MTLPTIILPGYLAGAGEYRALEQTLQELGVSATTVPLQRRDWLATLGGRPVTPILNQLDQTVKQVLQQHQTSQVNLIGHSAGGWISRIYLGEKPYDRRPWHARSYVATLVTLGTPHSSQERWTRRNLDFVNGTYPGAFYPDVRYVCVAGKAIYGEKSRQWTKWFSYKSYELTSGQGHCWGDGVTPIEAAHLEGADNLVLEGVMHSPRVSRGGASLGAHLWYGSPEPLKAWSAYLS
ncbi:MAG TPA: alpha/beta fold hydrolase [Candidatus Caenarcaniphilales bacterium]